VMSAARSVKVAEAYANRGLRNGLVARAVP
jgi:hypothetical protein